MERIYRVVFLGLFVIGFVGAVASADRNGKDNSSTNIVSLLKDVRLAEEINALNTGRWNQDSANINEDGLSRVEALFADDATFKTVRK